MLIALAERGFAPDWTIRAGIRRLLSKRVRRHDQANGSERQRTIENFVETLRQSPIAIETDAANDQHYEVPSAFFQQFLGEELKYSCCLYPDEQTSLDDAEQQMLELTCQRAQLADGMDILELGCGWGSLTIWMARTFPNARITAVSNSNSQREFIESRAAELRLRNVRVLTQDMREFETDEQFDRVVSVEMFEHMRNYDLLFAKISRWLRPAGKLFTHVFCHKDQAYFFESENANDWMGRHFFTGGLMPSEDLFSHFDEHLTIEEQWRVNGLHYWRTCEDWLRQLDSNREIALHHLDCSEAETDCELQLQRWRIFLMACAELFKYRNGEEWYVGHYLMRPTDSQQS